MNSILPIPPVPEDFNQQVMLRAWLAELPAAPVPDNFDAGVVKRTGHGNLWVINSILLAVAIGLGVWLAMAPKVVAVVHVPDVRGSYVDLTRLPPAPHTEHPAINRRPVRKSARQLFGRAGY